MPAKARHPAAFPAVDENKPTSWAARYGQAILRDGIAAIPTALLTYQAAVGLTAQEVWFTAAVLAHKWDAELPSPSLKRMAGQTGVSVIQLQRFRARLCERQLLRVREQHAPSGGQRPNTYDFGPLFQALEHLLGAELPLDNGLQDDEGEGAASDDTPPAAEPPDNSFTARYGRVIARAGIAAIPQGLFTHQAALGLTPQQVWFICYILAHRWTAAHPHPSLMRMDKRTGYGVRHLHELKDQLIARGYLRLVARYGADGRRETSGYDFSGLLDAVTAQLPPLPAAPAPPASAALPEQVVRLPRQVQRKGASQGGPQGPHRGGAHSDHMGGLQLGHRQGLQLEHRGELQQEHREATSRSGRRVTAGSQAGTAGGAYKEESLQEEPLQEEDSNRQDLRHENRARPPYSPFIAAVVTDYSREFGDLALVVSNVTQALRLWQASGLAEADFVEHLHEARRALRKAQAHGVLNKGAYWFAILRDHLGLREDA